MSQPSTPIELSTLLSEAGEAVVYVDKDWVVRYCNSTYAESVGLTIEQIVGRTPFEYTPTSFKRSIFYPACEHCLIKRQAVSQIGYSTVLSRWLIVRVFPVSDGVLMLANDATESVVKDTKLAQMVVRDPVTGLGNKLALEQRVNQLIQDATPFTVILLGLDGFSNINIAHGLAMGDVVLSEVASVLHSTSTPNESVYRTIGDEFAVLCEDPMSGSAERAIAFIAAIKRPVVLNGIQFTLGACAGSVQSPSSGADYELLLKRAALALQSAKQTGPNSLVVFKRELELALEMRAAIESDLRAAPDGSQFTLLFLPRVSVKSLSVTGGEALLRWAHPKRGLLEPGAFMSVAEQLGAMGAIDLWVLKQTLVFARQLLDKGIEIPLSINMSGASLSDAYLPERIAAALQEVGVPAKLLEVEIGEAALMRDILASSKIIASLHSIGVKVCVDDFGTGYSSFSHLPILKVDALKIDRTFVNGLVADQTSRKIVKSIVGFAHSMSLDAIAEGVETEAQLNNLRELRCDAFQGYVFSEPITASKFMRLVNSNPGTTAPDPFAI